MCGHNCEYEDEYFDLLHRRDELRNYIIQFRKAMVDLFPLICSYGPSYSRDIDVILAWSEISKDLQKEILDG